MSSHPPVSIGLIGCGQISSTYLEDFTALFPQIKVVACADLDMERAAARAGEFGIPRACTVEELLADRDVEIVLNLTIPAAHASINLAALQAGKHIYTEKPLAIRREDGSAILRTAKERGLHVGCAPDTVLGASIQTCRRLIDEGAIGQPVAAVAFMMYGGPENWHPAPEFFYQEGAGPMFDMGPYYLTTLITLLGPVRRVTGSTRVTFPERTITSQPLAGSVISVNTPTYVSGLMDFASGPIGTLITSFDVPTHTMPAIQIYGADATLQVPDPNLFGLPVYIRRHGTTGWVEVPLTHPYTAESRGLGVADMANALQAGTSPRASGDVAYHVLDIMHAFHESSNQGRHIELESGCERPPAMPEQTIRAEGITR